MAERKLKKTDKDYGTPVAGSKTEARGKLAHERVSREILELCCVIEENGIKRAKPDGDAGEVEVMIEFGRLFDIYTYISNKVVGVLLRARKYGIVTFEGETLFQGRDNNVPVILLHSSKKVREMFDKEYFNDKVYSTRIQISAETFLLEAEQRGRDQSQDVHVHVVGLGLGVWARSKDQPKFFLRGFQMAIDNILKESKLQRIKRIDFSWIPPDTNYPESKIIPNKPYKDIMITFTKRDPFEPLPDKEKDRLVVAMYAWDGNSLPGNEYWMGMLKSTGDPAAACCSQIAQFQNCYINKDMIQASNLHIASVRLGGIFHVADYQDKINKYSK